MIGFEPDYAEPVGARRLAKCSSVHDRPCPAKTLNDQTFSFGYAQEADEDLEWKSFRDLGLQGSSQIRAVRSRGPLHDL